MIFQLHPEHGKHFALSPVEAEQNEKNGWRTVSEDEFYGRVQAEPKRRGRPPKVK
jgi:hypothetical protein